MKNSFNLETKVVVVTGGSNGIGKAMVEDFAVEGAHVVFLDIDIKKGNETVQELKDKDLLVEFIPTDVSKNDSVKAAVDQIVSKYGVIDVLCNNAAVNIPGEAVELDEELWDKTMEVNVKSQFLFLKHVVPIMKDNGGGSIINTASANSYIAEPRLISYVTSKGAIKMLTKSAAIDYAPFNIRVNGICPGWTDTTFNDAHTELFGGREAVLKEISSIQPIGRPIEPSEIAKVALFLASDLSSCMTGSMILADGGITAGI